MIVVKKEEFFKNANSDYGIPMEIQKKLMNGNAQFLMDLAYNLKMYLNIYFKYLKTFHNTERAIRSLQSQFTYATSSFIREVISIMIDL